MLFNYITIAIRNLVKYKVFSFINIFGMAISLASCLLISLFVFDELSYDRHHPDGDRTFRIYNINDKGSHLPIVPYPFASFMQKDFPEIESTLRMMDTYGEALFEINGIKTMEGYGMFAEPTVFSMLTLNVLSGDASTALEKPNTIALSSSLAKKYFGDQNPVGKTIMIGGENYEVTALYADPGEHFHLKLNYIMSFATTGWASRFEDNWQRQQLFTYIKLKPGADAKALEAKFKPFVEKYAYPKILSQGVSYIPYLQNIRDIHLYSSNFEWEVAQRGDAQSVYILLATAIMILVISCLNFVNLSTARSIKRMKEVGVRKVVGAQRKQLIFQFIAESIIFTLIGLILAIGFAQLALPYLNTIIEKQLSIPFNILDIISGVLFCVALGALAGSYPALQLSRFRPALVLSRKNEAKSGSSIFRHSLVMVQFMLSFFLITGSWIVLSQNELIQNKNLGFNKEQVVVIPLRESQTRDPEVTKVRYSDHPNVISATLGFGLPGDIIAGDGIIEPVSGKNLSTNLFCVDYDYITTMGMKIIAGRDFSRDIPADSTEAFILNETAARTFGFGEPNEAIGKRVDWGRWDGRGKKKGFIIGIVQDFNFRSLRDKVQPTVLHIWPKASWKLALRIKPENVKETIAHFKKIYETSDPDWVFTYSFLDQNFDAMYKSEQKLGKLFSIFTYLAIIVACLGLFGLVEYSVNQRTKEISIRKVFGASISSLLMLLTRSYFVLLLIAFVLIAPFSYYVAQSWLSNFAYHIEISPILFLKAGAVIVLITVITVSFQSIKAALTNPASILKND